MERRDLLARLRAYLGDDVPPTLDGTDPADDDTCLDEVAARLLDRFRSTSDFEAFSLLFEVAHPRLSAIARQIARKVAVAVDPEDLVADFIAGLYTEIRPSPAVRRFLGMAYTTMRNDALDQLRRLKRSQPRHLRYHESLEPPSDPASTLGRAEHDAELARTARVFLSIVLVCFHALGERDRRVLIAREIDDLSYREVAERLALPPGQIGMIIKRARERLRVRIAEAMSRLDDRGGPA